MDRETLDRQCLQEDLERFEIIKKLRLLSENIPKLREKYDNGNVDDTLFLVIDTLKEYITAFYGPEGQLAVENMSPLSKSVAVLAVGYLNLVEALLHGTTDFAELQKILTSHGMALVTSVHSAIFENFIQTPNAMIEIVADVTDDVKKEGTAKARITRKDSGQIKREKAVAEYRRLKEKNPGVSKNSAASWICQNCNLGVDFVTIRRYLQKI